jgi:hypothetical protein
MKNVSIINLLPKDAILENTDFSHLFGKYLHDHEIEGPYYNSGMVIQALSVVLEEEYGRRIEYKVV